MADWPCTAMSTPHWSRSFVLLRGDLRRFKKLWRTISNAISWAWARKTWTKTFNSFAWRWWLCLRTCFWTQDFVLNRQWHQPHQTGTGDASLVGLWRSCTTLWTTVSFLFNAKARENFSNNNDWSGELLTNGLCSLLGTKFSQKSHDAMPCPRTTADWPRWQFSVRKKTSVQKALSITS